MSPVRSQAAAPATHWADIGESTFAAGLWLLYGVHRLFGRLPLRLLLYPVVTYYWLTQPVARRASLDYLARMQRAHSAIGAAPTWRHSLRHFLSFAETIADKTLAFSGRYRFEDVRYVGREPLDALIARGQGAVLITAHMGCLELCQAAADRQPGLQLTVLVHTRHAERFNRVLRRLNPDCGVKLLQVTDVDAATAVQLSQRIAAGEFVAIAGDRVPVKPSKTARVPFLGEDAAFPIGAYVLASLAQCPLFLLGCLREPRGHVVYFERLADKVELPRAERAQRIEALAALFARRMEALLVKAPYDWFNFFPFWARPAEPPLPKVSP